MKSGAIVHPTLGAMTLLWHSARVNLYFFIFFTLVTLMRTLSLSTIPCSLGNGEGDVVYFNMLKFGKDYSYFL